eukprot:CAMPEP_0118997942 /NCGR_PEP_ID=MMETSP1173-20130426/62628_1 /TAXON_ID=1034831 /ORGANISM="Rhizochromulina marina cf, Strain CCMP1243" /LENGTH=95 /DNA_ID=CAMNT_0006949417 /DNA_START=33 /DNA_END=320 /DNA_ORIENTATION=+
MFGTLPAPQTHSPRPPPSHQPPAAAAASTAGTTDNGVLLLPPFTGAPGCCLDALGIIVVTGSERGPPLDCAIVASGPRGRSRLELVGQSFLSAFV